MPRLRDKKDLDDMWLDYGPGFALRAMGSDQRQPTRPEYLASGERR